jgi:Tfp pilus assembly protein PilO
MTDKDSKYVILWICVLVSAVIIFTGWIFSIKFNFDKINNELGAQNKEKVEEFKKIEESYSDIDQILDQGGEKFDQLIDLVNSEDELVD